MESTTLSVHNGAVELTTDVILSLLPVGTILPWHSVGSNALNIPRGWALCDGSNPKAPNLSQRFLRGAANAQSTGSTGGSDTHNHGVFKNIHSPTGDGFHGNGNCYAGYTDHRNHLPPYTDVAYIIRLA